MSLSKKLRFEVFKRDGFVCQYCGAHPPSAILEADHITPRAAGGGDDIDNLITACFDCNRGKGARELATVPQTVAEKAAMLAEREQQIAAYNDLLDQKRARENDLINDLDEVFGKAFNHEFTDSFRESIRRNFLPKIDKDKLLMAITKACDKCHRADAATKYFCGICWTLIREQEGRR